MRFTALFLAIWAVATAANAANFNCSWNDSSDNWATAADWSSCNATSPDNGGGNTYDATITTPTAGPQLTNAVTVGSVTISNFGVWTLSGPGAAATLTGALDNGGSLNVDASGGGGSTLSIGGVLTNTWNVRLGNSSISSPTTVKAAALNNNIGAIGIQGGTTSQAVLQLGTGLTALSGYLTLDGPNAQVQVIGNATNNSALTGLSSNFGVLT